MKLRPLVNYYAKLTSGTDLGPVPFGVRRIFDIMEGTFEGERMRGKILPSGGDWLLVDAEGVGRLDVRATFLTDDGARIYVQYPGIIVMTPKVQAAVAEGGSTEYGESYFMTQPRFETSDPRYTWINRVVAVGEGRVAPNGVEYRVFEVLHD